MGEEMNQRSVHRAVSEISHLIGWSPDISSLKQLGNEDMPPVCDDSMVFSETKQICSQLQSSELGVSSPVHGGHDLLSRRSAINIYTAPFFNNVVKQEHPFSNSDSRSLAGSSPLLVPKASHVPPLFPAIKAGERTSLPLGSKAWPWVSGNGTPLWTTRSSGASSPQKGEERSTPCSSLALKDSCVDTKKSNDENARKRIRSHVPFTTFKVRKEKLGDRVTALQQLVSPFGKTDTASVLYDAIEYIKFLHDQVTVLSTPYMMLSHEVSGRNMGGEEAVTNGGLRSRGLCLVPISTTLHVAKDNTQDFWAPTFGGNYR